MNLLANLLKRQPQRVLYRSDFENVLGTSLEIQVVASTLEVGRQAEITILEEIDRLEAIFNAYNPNSELSRWQATFEQDVAVSLDLARVLDAAEKWRIQTGGAFNPAVEALTRVWARHANENTEVSENELAPILAYLAQPLWSVNGTGNTARRQTTLAVTLNSIAKGAIIDAAALQATQGAGVQQVLLNIGGDIRHCGTESVTISIANPRSDAENAEPACRVKIQNQGIATSGNYRRGFQIGEHWYSHVLDPRSGWPADDLVGVSVLAPDAMTADVLATAFSILKPAESVALANSRSDIGVFIIDSTGKEFSNSFWDERRN